MSGTLSLTGNPSISVVPISNPGLTYATLAVQTSSNNSGSNEYMVTFDFDANIPGNKVALYAGTTATDGSIYTWASNFVMYVPPGGGTDPSFVAQGIEVDLANNSGISYGNSSFLAPAFVGVSVTSSGGSSAPYSRVTSAFSMQADNGFFNYGYTCLAGVVQFSYSDFSDSQWCFLGTGSHLVGLDFTLASLSVAAIRIGNSQVINARNAANTVDLNLMYLSASDTMAIGESSMAGIYMACHTNPFTDNSFSFGNAGARWAALWAVNGTIQTSDARLKTDIKPLPQARQIIEAVDPITFRWIDGGLDWQEAELDQEVHETTTETIRPTSIELRDGKPVAVPKPVVVQHIVTDDLPIQDEAGQPVVTVIPARDAVYGKDGRLLQAATPEATVTKTYPTPRKTTIKAKGKQAVPKAGKRVHWGFRASDLKAVIDRTGMDWGAYVKAEDGTEHIRPDQLIPVLWKGQQEIFALLKSLSDENAELKRQVAALRS